MIDPTRQRGDERALAWLRLALVAVILVSEQLINRRHQAGLVFGEIVTAAMVYAVVGIVVSLRSAPGPMIARVQPTLDVVLLAGLTAASGGAFSDVRKAFFVIPLAAAFKERPRSTGLWSIAAVVAFSIAAAVAGGHLSGSPNTWQGSMLGQDLYLLWTGAAATMLAVALRRRSAETEALAESRQRLVTHAIHSVEQERTRLAGALHDEPVQNLIAARHDLRRAERTGDAESFARLDEALTTTVASLREEIFKLHPHVLDHVGLGSALQQVAERCARDHRVRIEVDIEDAPPVVHQQALYSLGRELLGNASRHARASVICLRLSRDREGVRLEVIDDGRGIPEGRLHAALLEGHVGLAEITERVAALGGQLAISSAGGSGTRIRITLPTVGETGQAQRPDPTARLLRRGLTRRVDAAPRTRPA